MTLGAIALDLDGVIVRTNFHKHDAMLSLFVDHPERQQAISAFILANGGVPRRAKLEVILRDHLGVRPTGSNVSEYLRRYAIVLDRQVAEAPLVPGVAEFLDSAGCALYVCSSAPELEVHDQIARRGLGSRFAGVFCGDTPKSEALRTIAAGHHGHQVVFFGDSRGDYEAAKQAEVAFVGVICERDNFAGLPVAKLVDFTSRQALAGAIRQALDQSAT